ncbi:MAG: tetratricopeptide repeat protein, partial [Candidatus Binataceae bacterium]
VRHGGMARGMGQEGEMRNSRGGQFAALISGAAVLACLLGLHAASTRAGTIPLPPEARQAMDDIYGGDPDAAVAIARTLEQSQPDHPLGFLLEAEAQWWKIYCQALEIKWGMVDGWKRGKQPGDRAYMELAEKIIALSRQQIAKSDSVEMRVYAGIGWALEARLYSLRGENRGVARAGVNAREQFIRALALDPDQADATAGLGLYNYYVDTLSTFVKMLRFFMGIPGGNKELGLRQMQAGIDRGALLAVDTRFYLARNLRTYDHEYQKALNIAQPLAERYPANPVFLLLTGNLNVELGHDAEAAKYFNSVVKLRPAISPCQGCSGCAGCAACLASAVRVAQTYLRALP